MNNNTISLAYLETLSTSDLLLLADEYGLDIPEHLNRRFIISELFEIADEMMEDSNLVDLEESESPVNQEQSLPETYNETKIDAIMKNPAWVYVFWDISAGDREEFINTKDFSNLILKVHFLTGDDNYELEVSNTDVAQYIFIPNNNKSFFIELLVEYKNGEKSKLTSSRIIKIPVGSKSFNLESLEEKFDPILELSGIKKLIKSMYDAHRQSFN